MVQSLVKEIALRSSDTILSGSSPFFQTGEQIETIYFGGGTPSILDAGEMALLLRTLNTHFPVEESAEITLEANPEDISQEKLREWRHAGINRLSIGVQSFHPRQLQWMNRNHDGGQALKSIEMVKAAGFENYSIDLIYGVPGMQIEEWQADLDKVTALRIPHIACYALTVEPRTALHKMIQMKKKEDVKENEQAAHFRMMTQSLMAAGYEHYEISNFALPGKRSRHNSSYWQYKKYLGIGPSAHSFNGQQRMWNVANNAKYIQSLEENDLPVTVENLTEPQQLNEYIMLSLRTSEGMDLQRIGTQFSEGEKMRIEKLLERINADYLLRDYNNIALSEKGKLFADGIAAGLFG